MYCVPFGLLCCVSFDANLLHVGPKKLPTSKENKKSYIGILRTKHNTHTYNNISSRQVKRQKHHIAFVTTLFSSSLVFLILYSRKVNKFMRSLGIREKKMIHQIVYKNKGETLVQIQLFFIRTRLANISQVYPFQKNIITAQQHTQTLVIYSTLTELCTGLYSPWPLLSIH